MTLVSSLKWYQCEVASASLTIRQPFLNALVELCAASAPAQTFIWSIAALTTL